MSGRRVTVARTGTICRSPVAEVVLRTALQREGRADNDVARVPEEVRARLRR